ncbi:MAG: hypothetical protein AAF702_11280 [Chloroflexota bacterium]
MSLLAVDLGLRSGMALYGKDGRLCWYRSHNFGAIGRMRRGVPTILKQIPDLSWLVLEGGGQLEQCWLKEADRREIQVLQIGAERWRTKLLHPREQRSGSNAKRHADHLARAVIDWSNASRPTSLRHDAAEAILIGLWGVLEIGWLDALPSL